MPFRLSYGVVQGVSFLTGKKSFGSENRYLALRERKDRYSMVLKTPFFNFDQLILEEKKKHLMCDTDIPIFPSLRAKFFYPLWNGIPCKSLCKS